MVGGYFSNHCRLESTRFHTMFASFQLVLSHHQVPVPPRPISHILWTSNELWNNSIFLNDPMSYDLFNYLICRKSCTKICNDNSIYLSEISFMNFNPENGLSIKKYYKIFTRLILMCNAHRSEKSLSTLQLVILSPKCESKMVHTPLVALFKGLLLCPT